jgi:hypothetical protein
MPEKLNARLVNNGKDGIVAEVSSVINVADANGNFSTEQKIGGKLKFDSCHTNPAGECKIVTFIE